MNPICPKCGIPESHTVHLLYGCRPPDKSPWPVIPRTKGKETNERHFEWVKPWAR